jgi:hypothetical protein
VSVRVMSAAALHPGWMRTEVVLLSVLVVGTAGAGMVAFLRPDLYLRVNQARFGWWVTGSIPDFDARTDFIRLKGKRLMGYAALWLILLIARVALS